MKDLVGYTIDARDGHVGKVKDFLFDEETLTVRYLVADTGNWLSSNKVLITPEHLAEPDLGRYENRFPIDLTKEQIEKCPPIDSDAPVSRQYEEAFMKHHTQSPYWLEAASFPVIVDPPTERIDQEEFEPSNHLRSLTEVMAYDVVANDGEIGYLEDFIIDCESWKMRFVIVDLNKWLPGGKRLFDVAWINGIHYRGHLVRLGLRKKQIETGPAFDPATPVNEDYQRNLYDYYGRPMQPEVAAVTPF